MYRVDISPAAIDVLNFYLELCYTDNGSECAYDFLDAYDEKLGYLELQPGMGCGRIKNVPEKYRVLNFWPHLWLVFQIYETEKCVKIEYIIDDRQNYGSFLR